MVSAIARGDDQGGGDGDDLEQVISNPLVLEGPRY